MANYTINNLTELTGTASGDFVPLWDTSASVTRKATLTNIFAAVFAAANTFTAGQTIAPASTSVNGLAINMPTGSTGNAVTTFLNSVQRVAIKATSTANYLHMIDDDLGNGNAGAFIQLGRNSNATNAGAGYLRFTARGAAVWRVWVDNVGALRIHSNDPTTANDTAGTIVGTQTSSLDSKNILGEAITGAEALESVVSAAKAIKRFTYKSGAVNGEEFSGLIIDYAPRYGMDRDDDHKAGKSLNVINAIGDLMLAVSYLAEREKNNDA